MPTFILLGFYGLVTLKKPLLSAKPGTKLACSFLTHRCNFRIPRRHTAPEGLEILLS